MASMKKLVFYQLMRGQGARMYSFKSWKNATIPSIAASNRKANFCSVKSADIEVPTVEKPKMSQVIKEKLGMQGNLKYPQSYLLHSGCRLYLSATEAVLYNNIYDELKMTDSMMTWHKLVTLHIWLIMLRLQSEGREGQLCRDNLIYAFLSDKREKLKEIGEEINYRFNNKHHDQLHETFLGSLVAYDDGFLGSDMDLAGAIWRNIFERKQDVCPEHLELLVHYVRKQVLHLDTIGSENLLTNGLIPFLPLHGNKVTDEIYDTLHIFRETSPKSLNS